VKACPPFEAIQARFENAALCRLCLLLAQNLYSDSRTRAKALELYGKARKNIPPDLESSEAEKERLKALEAAWQRAQKGER
jgi:hypothetical protein